MAKTDKIGKKLLFIFLPLLLFFAAAHAQAAGLVPCGGDTEPACEFCHLFVMIERVIDLVLFTLVPPIAVLMLAIGGGMFFFASGNQELLGKSRQLLWSVVIGLIIIYSAWILIGMFLSIIGVAQTEFGSAIKNWFNIDCPI